MTVGNSVVRYDDATQKEVMALLGIEGSKSHITLLFKLAEHYGLDVLTKEISLIPKKGPMIGVWGRLHIAHRSGKLDGLELDDEWEDDKYYKVRCVVWRSDKKHPAAKVIGRVGKQEGTWDDDGTFKPKEWPYEIARARAMRAALGFAFNIHDSFDNQAEEAYDLPPDERFSGEEVSESIVVGAGSDFGGSAGPTDEAPRTVTVGGHTLAQKLVIAAKAAGITDDQTRHDVIYAASDGTYGRGTEIPETVDEAVRDRLFAAFDGIREKTVELRYSPDGEPRLVRPRRG